MSSCSMIGRLWIVMTIAINNASVISGEPRRHPRRLSRSCETRNVDNPCLNGGRCHVTMSIGTDAEPALVTCRCPPAWTGVTCELERDPCSDGTAVCGPGWSCSRNSSNTHAGYDCGCGGRSGWRRMSDDLPRCVDVDECALLTPACFNGGSCYNRAGTFYCRCKPGFSGGRCQLGAPPSLRSSDGWHAWSAWAPCSGPCDAGRQRRERICGRRRSGCPGESEQSRVCAPRGCTGRQTRPASGGEEGGGMWREDSDDEASQPGDQGSARSGRGRTRKRIAVKPHHGRKEPTGIKRSTNSGFGVEKVRRWRDVRKAEALARNWKLTYYLGYEPVRRKRSLAQIESYDDLELTLMGSDQRAVRDLGEKERTLYELSQSSGVHERDRRSAVQASIASLQPGSFAQKRFTETIESTSLEESDVEDHVSPESRNVIMEVLDTNNPSASFVISQPGKSDEEDLTQTLTNFTIQAGDLRVQQNISSDLSLEETLRRPAAAVRALVAPAVGRARAALLRLRLTEAARAEQQEAALTAAEAAERRLQEAREEAARRTAARRAAERRLWHLLDRTEAVARRGAEAQRAARKEAVRRETAEARLEAERRRRRRLRQEEAAAAARHSALRTRLLRQVQAVRRQAQAQSAALQAAQRQAESAERRAAEAEAERRRQRSQLRQLQVAERQKLVQLQRSSAEQLSAALREAEAEERRAQEAESAWKKAEHQVRPDPEPPPEPRKHKEVETNLSVEV